MKTSITSKHQFLKSQLLELVSISNLVEQKDRFFVTSFEKWLQSSELKLKELGFTEASHFSVYKSQLTLCKMSKARHKHKLVFNKSVETIKLAQRTLYNIFMPLDQKMTQSEEIVENLLILIDDSGEMQNLRSDNFSEYVQNVWQFMIRQEAFKNHIQQLKLLISLTDIKLLIGQKITL